ncbi:transglutaminase-like domain-containing protein [Parasediminibacterium sp. JCM 36343]|uniref:transglutaminase-like domain-containing protein n=1 Tax=Parasediminibacterium sp. JCM 36343 TaxID=3374279 RepID=UPI00397A0AEB
MKLTQYYTLIVCVITISCSGVQNSTTDESKYQKNASFSLIYKIKPEGYIRKLFLKVKVPYSIKDRQWVKSMAFSTQPDSVVLKNDLNYAYFHFDSVDEAFKLKIDCEITIYQQIKEIDTSQLAAAYTPENLSAEKYIESDCPEIQDLAAGLKQANNVETVMKTYSYVKEKLTYYTDYGPDTVGARRALKKGYGDCSEYCDLFVALLRANHIPAKSIHGYTMEMTTTGKHTWAEVFLPKNGWVMMDPTTSHGHVTNEDNTYTIAQRNKYIIMSQQRHDPAISKNSDYYIHYQKGSWDSKVNIHESYNSYLHS